MMTAKHMIRRLGRCGFGLAALAGALLLGVPAAQAASDIAPYLEVEQVVLADLNGGGDVLTYTAVAVGVDAQVSTRRVEAQVSYRYERRFGWEDDLVDEDIHSGIAQARIALARDVLSLDAGAIAARSRVDPRGPLFGFASADGENIAEVYGAYAGPTLTTNVGPLTVGASYRLGYVHVDDHSLAGSGFPGGPLDRYESSTSHSANVSVGMGPGELPVGWTIAAGYQREDTDRLDQRFEGKFVRGDVVVPLSSSLAVTAGVGYEKLEASQQDILRDSDGLPVVTPGGKLVADPSKPRLLAYDQSGLIWDAGVIWRPTPRTELQARVGERYGGTTVTGSLSHQINEDFALNAFVYDSVSSFGRTLILDVSGIPTKFNIKKHGLNDAFGMVGCIFGTEPGTGVCLDDSFQSIATANFRSRGAHLLLSGSRGVWDLGLGAGYDRRKYLAPDIGSVASLHGVVDESASVYGLLGRNLTRTSGIDFEAYANWYDSGLAGSDNVFSSGITATYYRSFLWERLQAEASVGLYTTDFGNGEDSVIAAGLIGLSYTF